MTIAFAYNVKKELGDGVSTELDFDFPETIEAIKKTIESLGHTVMEIEANEEAFEKLKNKRGEIDLVFNIAEGLRGDARESQIPLFGEMLGIPYTHSSPTTHALSLHKAMAKLAVAGAGVQVPAGVVLEPGGDEAKTGGLRFPVIIKPNAEGSSVGVFDANVVKTREEMSNRIKETRGQGFAGNLLVEEFIDGREFTVAVIGDEEIEILPVIEQKFGFLPTGMQHIAGYELKWVYEDALKNLCEAYECPAILEPSQQRELEEMTRSVYQALEVRDCARLDYRMDKSGKLYFLEINTLPGINPSETVISYFPLAARKAGYTYPQLVEKIINLARKRYGI